MRARPRRLIIPLLVAVAVAPPPAGASVAAQRPVIPQVSIRGVRPGMTPAEVRSAVGRAPDGSSTAPHPILGRVRVWRFGGLRVGFDGVRAGRTVLSVSSAASQDRTSGGVGRGTTEVVLRARVPGAQCATEYGYRHCWVGVHRAGRIVTDFSLSRRGRVTRVTLGRVVD